ncbi:universal stress protein [Arthrobacter cryoconiti]|uniref:Universal stress protein n=1 Tax=Arthrobacter cryoconiti TaxID=748907 RepID=A0ABV8QWS3_9MICC|nr:universal stress protein [Arthrobacter cryoconiti]MCC9069647.1 universal stress protein [Arthrobacter cryoconiti]
MTDLSVGMRSEAQPRIVVGVDGSETSVRAVQEAVRLAAELGGVVEAVAAWEPPTKGSSYEALGIGSFAEGARHVLDGALAEAFGESLPALLSSRVERGSAATVLVAASEGARYVVVGRRGRGGVMGLLLGSAGAAVLNQAHCPVMVVR